MSSTGLETFARLLHRGTELLRDGDPGQAKEHLERALALFPDNAVARHLFALSLFQVGHLERALVLYEALLLEFPTNTAAKVNLAVVLLKLGRASAVRPLLEEVVRAAPDHRRAWGYLGVALEQLGLIAEAEGAFIAGHYASAARRLRERHPLSVLSPTVPAEAQLDSSRAAMPAFRRRTLPPDPWSSGATSTGSVGYAPLQRFAVTLRPPDLVGSPTATPADERSLEDPTTSMPRAGPVEEIPFEQTVVSAARRSHRRPRRTRQSRTGRQCRSSTPRSLRCSSCPTRRPSSCTRRGSSSSGWSRTPTRAREASRRAGTSCTRSPGR